MLETIIVGRESNLTKALSTKLKGTYIFSVREIISGKVDFEGLPNQGMNVVFNNFLPANSLGNLKNPYEYVEAAIGGTGKALSLLLSANVKVNKIIYTSSSSVYGDNTLCRETDSVRPQNLHASLKISNEKLIEKFCVNYDIPYIITRIFNMYGGADNFSVISKIITNYRSSGTLMLVNQGEAIRDFVHVDDVIKVYISLLGESDSPNIINIGTGVGHSIHEIINFLGSKGFLVKTKSCVKEELKESTASVDLLKKTCSLIETSDVKKYILECLKT